MNLATGPTRYLSEEQQRTYALLADAALQQYALGTVSLAFIQHNAGIVFRVTPEATGEQYLLKLHKRVGAGGNPSAEQLEPGLRWLAAFAQASGVITNLPIPTNHGAFVGYIRLASEELPIACTLQQWVEGHAPNGDLTEQQASQLGQVMACLHNFSRTYPSTDGLPAHRHDTHELARNIDLMRSTIPETLLTPQDVAILHAAGAQISESMDQLGYTPDVWGPIHGDLHYDNLLIDKDEIRPIDFPGLRLGHYLYDIGVTIYHTFHQGIAIREAFFAGYQSLAALPPAYQKQIEGFITYAAIDSLAWNSTIPSQLESPLFQGNLQQLIEDYCAPVVQGRSFLFG